jgi:hypothetical protein
MLNKKLLLVVTERFAIFIECELSGEDSAIMNAEGDYIGQGEPSLVVKNDTGIDYRARYLYVLYPDLTWYYSRCPGLPDLNGVGLRDGQPEIMDPGGEEQKTLKKALQERKGFVIPLAACLALLEEGQDSSWRVEGGFLVNKKLKAEIPIGVFNVVRQVREIKDLVERGVMSC